MSMVVAESNSVMLPTTWQSEPETESVQSIVVVTMDNVLADMEGNETTSKRKEMKIFIVFDRIFITPFVKVRALN